MTPTRLSDRTSRRPRPAGGPAPIDISLLLARVRAQHGDDLSGPALSGAIADDIFAEADRYLADRGIDPDGPDDDGPWPGGVAA